MKFLWFKQAGEGCDYSIGCGARLEKLQSTTNGEMLIEALGIIKNHTHSESRIDKAFILELSQDVSHLGEVAVAEHKAEIEAEKIEQKRAQLQRLKRELGED